MSASFRNVRAVRSPSDDLRPDRFNSVAGRRRRRRIVFVRLYTVRAGAAMGTGRGSVTERPVRFSAVGTRTTPTRRRFRVPAINRPATSYASYRYDNIIVSRAAGIIILL